MFNGFTRFTLPLFMLFEYEIIIFWVNIIVLTGGSHGLYRILKNNYYSVRQKYRSILQSYIFHNIWRKKSSKYGNKVQLGLLDDQVG